MSQQVDLDHAPLTPEELECLEMLTKAWNQFLKLPELGPWDRQEFMHFIHGAECLVFSRAAYKRSQRTQTN